MKPNHFVLFLSALLLWTGCQQETPQVSEDYTISTKSLSFTDAGGSQDVNIRTEANVSLESEDPSWCTVTEVQTSSAVMKRFTVKAEPLNGTESRSTYITVAVGSRTDRIEVSQSGVDLILPQTDKELTAQAETWTIEVSCASDYQVSTEAYWLTIGEKSAEGVQVSATANINLSPRSAEILFTSGSTTIPYSVSQKAANNEVPEADMTGMESDAKSLIKKMTMGINLGNTLEATGGETAWGNPTTTEEIITYIKSLGFNAIRIPCSWHQYLSDEENYVISDSWMNRVKEVVDYCVDNDIYTILNIHWDQGWLENDIPNGYNEAVDAEQGALWLQIATVFRDYDEHLIFAGTNEPNVDDAADMEVLLRYEQTFVDAVRATGGRNAYRVLIVQGPSTDIDKTDRLMSSLPSDSVEDRLAVEVHYYTPWTFCGLEEDADWGKAMYFWGKDQQSYATGEYADRWDPNYNEDYCAAQFAKMKSKFWDNGIPIILGEYSVCAWSKDGLTTAEGLEGYQKSCEAFNLCVTSEARANGCAPFYWHAGKDLIDRSAKQVLNQGILDAIIEGAKTSYPN